MSQIREGLKLIEEVISLLRQLKKAVTIDYREIAEELDEIIVKILTAHTKLVEFINDFLTLDLDNKEESEKWAKSLSSAKVRVAEFRLHCHEIAKICNNNFYNRLKTLFNNDEVKLLEARRTLDGLSKSDYTMEETIKKILNDHLKPMAVAILFDFSGEIDSIKRQFGQEIADLKNEYRLIDRQSNQLLELHEYYSGIAQQSPGKF
jgi:hypothetical protein